MLTLRLTQSAADAGAFRVEAALEGDGARQTATAQFEFPVTEQDREDLRWYLEDYLQYNADPAPKIAYRIEQRISELGASLFEAIFHANGDMRDLWSSVRNRLNETRVEISTTVREAAALPWELLRDPKTDTALALRSNAFVRIAHSPALRPRIPIVGEDPIRILLVISRPGGADDVPFRSVARRLVNVLSFTKRDTYQLDVLRPPTFEQLSKKLRAARTTGQPYHIVHFDGHGTYDDVTDDEQVATLRRGLTPLVLSAPRVGAHGYLLFEKPAVATNVELVDGPALGRLLAESEVPVLVLNACRSAHAEPNAEPAAAPQSTDSKTALKQDQDVHAQVRAFGSLAQEVVDAGVASVVAMRYNVYVVTAAQFVADLYESLSLGQTLGEAVTLGRKQLEAQPLREIAYQPRALQDWMVPIVYETAPVALFSRTSTTRELTLKIAPQSAAPASGAIASELEKEPDVGFFGRDETLLALERAFDTQSVVLLHAYAGSGKTSTAAEFARWYHLTGGIAGPVVFTSFEKHKTLPQVLNQDIGQLFGPLLEQSGVNWLALSDEERRAVALQVLELIPVLWIWDNVEPIAGFPAGTPSAWSNAEQDALSDFLRAASRTKAKFLLTSRRDEREWIGNLAARIAVPPMPMQERVQLARAIAIKHGRRLAEVDDWMPLLRFTEGNPLTITVLVGQAFRDGLRTSNDVEKFVARLRAGESAFQDESAEGRHKSLGASLSYGFEHAFNEAERQQLALLQFFQGSVGIDVLCSMCDHESPWVVPGVAHLTRNGGVELLDRAAEIGLLVAHGNGYYSIHPALPWFFDALFQRYYRDDESSLAATESYVRAVVAMAAFCQRQYISGNSDVISVLAAEESNLLHARQISLEHDWWKYLIAVMQGLSVFYDYTGHRATWVRLVNEITPKFVDAVTGAPLAGREEQWIIVNDYRVLQAIDLRQWADAERLQRAAVTLLRQRSANSLSVSREMRTETDNWTLRTLSVGLSRLGQILHEMSDPAAVEVFHEAISLDQQTGDLQGEASDAFHLGHVYKDVERIRDLAKAEKWYRHSLSLIGEGDQHGQAKRLSQLGLVAYERFSEARRMKRPPPEIGGLLNEALRFYLQALELDPSDAREDLATDHAAIGSIYAEFSEYERALVHWREAIRFDEETGNLFSAAVTRLNVARGLSRIGRIKDAMDYADAALQGFSSFGPAGAAYVKQCRTVIEWIEKRK